MLCHSTLSYFVPDKSKLPSAQGMLFAALSRTHFHTLAVLHVCFLLMLLLTAMETGFCTQIRVLSRGCVSLHAQGMVVLSVMSCRLS